MRVFKKRRKYRELDPDRIFGAAIIGDDWVETMIAHLDPLETLTVLRAKTVRMDVKKGHTPSCAQLERALVSSWQEIQGNPMEYNKFFVCLPPWCCHSTDAESDIEIRHDPKIPWKKTPVVKPRHVARLEEAIGEQNSTSKHVMVDLMHHCFVLDNGRKVADPVGTTSGTLTLEAHLVLAEFGTTTHILNTLYGLGIQAAALMSSNAAMADMLSPIEKEAGIAVIDVGHMRTGCAIYQDGVLRYTSHFDEGCNGVVDSVASDIGVSTLGLKNCVNDWKEISCNSIRPEDRQLELFDHAAEHPSLRPLSRKAAKKAESIIGGVMRFLKAASDKSIKFEAITLSGDDYLTLRTVSNALADKTGLVCDWRKPPRLRVHDGSKVAAASRATGVIRQCAPGPRRGQFYLEHYNEGFLDTLHRKTAEGAHSLFWRLVDNARNQVRRDRPIYTPSLKLIYKGLRALTALPRKLYAAYKAHAEKRQRSRATRRVLSASMKSMLS